MTARILHYTTKYSLFLKASSFYAAGQVAMKLMDMLSFSILVSILTPTELGLVGTAFLFGFLITDFLSLGIMRIAVPRFIVDATYSKHDLRRNGFGVFIVYFTLLSGLIALLGNASAIFRSLEGMILPFQVYCFSFVIRSIVYMEFEILKMEQKYAAQTFLEVIPSLLNLGFILLLTRLLANDLLGGAFAQLISWLCLFSYFFLRFYVKSPPSLRLFRELVSYSGPLVLHRSMNELNSMGSRWIVLLAFGLEATGIYTFLSRVGDLIKLLIMPLQKAWLPVLLSYAKNNDHTSLRDLAGTFLVASTTITILFIGAFGPIAGVMDWNAKYVAYYDLLPAFALSNWVLSLYLIFGVGFLVARRTSVIIPITILTAFLCLGLSYAFGVAFGLEAIPYAAVISNGFFVVATTLLSRRYFYIEDRTLTVLLAASLLVVTAVFVLTTALTGGGIWQSQGAE